MSEKRTGILLEDEHYVCPKMAYGNMRIAQNAGQTVYLYGSAGTGKTSFVAKFLEGKKYYYSSMADTGIEKTVEAVHEELEKLCKKNNARTIVVLDDLHLLEEQDARGDCGRLVEELSGRRDVWLILISRAPLSKWLKAVYVKYIFVIIGEEELFFNEQEQKRYLEKWELSPTEAALKRLKDLSCGHPLFFRLVAMRLKNIPKSEAAENREGAELQAIEKAGIDYWDYLEAHVYEQWDVQLQEFLMAISIVEQFDLKMAQQITKKKDAGRLIQKAQETGNILTERWENDVSIYELRRTVIYSMRRRASLRYSQDYIMELYYSAGTCYEMEGNAMEALRMYEMCRNEEGISRILIENMRKNPASGDYFALKRYYLQLSEEKIKGSVELMAGMSMLQSILLNEEESERWYQELLSYSKKRVGSEKKEAEIRLLYLDIALPQRGIVKMTDLLKRAGVLLTEKRLILPELSVTSNMPSMMNGGKDFCEWSRRDRELARSIGKLISMVLGKYGKGLVNLALAESLFEKGGDDFEVATLAGTGRMQAESGGKAEQVFVSVGIMTWLSIITNNMENARSMLDSFMQIAQKDAPRTIPNIHAMETRMNLYEGRIGKAFEWLSEAPDEDTEFNSLERYRYLTKVRVYLAAGRREKALLLLEKLRFYAEKMHRTYISIEVQILEAIALYRLGREDWREILQTAVEMAEDYYFVRILTREGGAVLELLREGSIVWRKPKFKKQVLEECRNMADVYPAYLKEKQEGRIILSDKALKILRLQAEGLSVEDIAGKLGLSKAGVKYYNQETYRKLGVNNKAAAVTEARNRRLL